ncbi:MAG: thioredoxin family protein [Bacteroidota bacterium]|nr:thioredoxin family protein [Bacteroidota bacterium]
MKKHLVEIFVEKNCRACEEVVTTIARFISYPDIDVRVFNRETDSSVFRERNVVVCPATFVNHRLVFYGGFQTQALEKYLQ